MKDHQERCNKCGAEWTVKPGQLVLHQCRERSL